MNDKIEIIRKTRSFLLQSIQELNGEQLNKIPVGFNNNIIWNLGHMVAAQEGICYIRAGLKAPSDEDFFNRYRPGSKPGAVITEDEMQQIKNLLLSSLEVLEQDHQNKIWAAYTAWSTRYGVEIKNIDEAINFLQFHEGLHSGHILSMKKIVCNQPLF